MGLSTVEKFKDDAKMTYFSNGSGIFEGTKILIVDDLPDNQVLLAHYMKQTMASVTFVSNGLDAISAVTSENFDLILMDLQMPVMDGFQAAKQIRKLRPLIPIVALTANVFAQTDRKFSDCHFSDFLTKPIHFSLLFKTMQKCLAHGKL